MAPLRAFFIIVSILSFIADSLAQTLVVISDSPITGTAVRYQFEKAPPEWWLTTATGSEPCNNQYLRWYLDHIPGRHPKYDTFNPRCKSGRRGGQCEWQHHSDPRSSRLRLPQRSVEEVHLDSRGGDIRHHCLCIGAASRRQPSHQYQRRDHSPRAHIPGTLNIRHQRSRSRRRPRSGLLSHQQAGHTGVGDDNHASSGG